MFHSPTKITLQENVVLASFRCSNSKTDVFRFGIEEFRGASLHLREQLDGGSFAGWDFTETRLCMKLGESRRVVSIGVQVSDHYEVYYRLSLNEVTLMFAEFDSQVKSR